MEIYKDLNTQKNKDFENLLNSRLSKTKIEEGKIIDGLVTKITNKFGFGKVSRKCINVTDVTKTIGGHSGSSGDKSIEDLSKRKGTLENYERKFKETYESPSSQFRTKKLKEIGNEIKTINTTFSKRTRRGRIRKILEKN